MPGKVYGTTDTVCCLWNVDGLGFSLARSLKSSQTSARERVERLRLEWRRLDYFLRFQAPHRLPCEDMEI